MYSQSRQPLNARGLGSNLRRGPIGLGLDKGYADKSRPTPAPKSSLRAGASGFTAAASSSKFQPPKPPSKSVDPSGDPINDALDRLLHEARASLDYLDKMAAQVPEEELRKARRQLKQDGGSSFWNPRCGGVWSVDDILNDDCDSDLDSDLASSAGSEDESLWNILHGSKTPSTSSNSRIPTRSQTPTGLGSGIGGGDAGRSRSHGNAGRFGGQAFGSKKASFDKEPADESVPNMASEAGGPAPRACAGGFQFGNFGNPRQEARAGGGQPSDKPEVAITQAFITAQASGPGSVRKVLKRMLLQWHPDKAPQGDDAASVASREEATRVLRFILQERERLGI